MDNRPIGVFDSGVGGLSIWRAIRRLLPHESLIFFADSGHVPYGEKSTAELHDLTGASSAVPARHGREDDRRRLQHGDGARDRLPARDVP